MIHIAYVDTIQIDDALYDELYAAASPERKQRADRYLRHEDSVRCIAADGLLRHAIRQTPGFPKTCTIGKGPQGKPYIKEAPSFHYNLSHSGHWAAIAWGSTPVGLDIETLNMGTGKEQIARQYFTPDEQDYVFQGDDADRCPRFFQIWTSKESYLKYLGTGLHRALDSFNVCTLTTSKLHTWFLPDACMTLCATDSEVAIHLLSAEQLR